MAETMKLFATAVGSTDAAAQLDIPEDGVIDALLLDVAVTGADALNDGVAVEASFSSTSGFNSNDTRSSLIGVRAYQGFLTTGGGPVGKVALVTGVSIPISAGERLYLHVSFTGTATVFMSCWLYFTPKARGGRPVRRVRL